MPGESSAGTGEEDPFNFFLTSLDAMRTLSDSADGFGGNYGGIAGADSICNATAELAGVTDKTWVAFLSATAGGPDGGPLHAIDRIGDGPYYDRNARLVAASKADLLHQRPIGDAQAISDLSDEQGVPGGLMDHFHDVITGSDAAGRLASTDPASTCFDWTNADDVPNNTVMCGHSWPRGGGSTDGDVHWLAAHPVPGCAPGIAGAESGEGGNCIGCAGGYGALYCFAVDAK